MGQGESVALEWHIFSLARANVSAAVLAHHDRFKARIGNRKQYKLIFNSVKLSRAIGNK